MERILEREFILKASKILSLQDDPFFQTFDPNDKDPVWKAIIKNLIGWNQQDHNEVYIIENTIQKSYLKYIEAYQTPGGAIKIDATHENPKVAAQYANQIMELVSKL